MFTLLIAADKPAGCEALDNWVKENFGDLFQVLKTVAEKNIIEKVLCYRPDFVFLDIDRPRLGILKDAAQIRDCLPECRLIVISAFPNFSYTRAALSIGANEYIDKPVSFEKMKAGVYRAMKNANIQPAFPNGSHLQSYDENSEGRTSRAKALLSLAIDYLERNYQRNISLEDTAERIQISPFYLSKLFKKSVGENFVNYLTAVRIRKAKEFLTDPHYTIKDVCYQVGYKDPNYFARVFKKTCGITPSQYQTRHLSVEMEMGLLQNKIYR